MVKNLRNNLHKLILNSTIQERDAILDVVTEAITLANIKDAFGHFFRNNNLNDVTTVKIKLISSNGEKQWRYFEQSRQGLIWEEVERREING